MTRSSQGGSPMTRSSQGGVTNDKVKPGGGHPGEKNFFAVLDVSEHFEAKIIAEAPFESRLISPVSLWRCVPLQRS